MYFYIVSICEKYKTNYHCIQEGFPIRIPFRGIAKNCARIVLNCDEWEEWQLRGSQINFRYKPFIHTLKSRKLFPSESNIRKIWVQKVSPLPAGKTWRNSWSRWARDSFPFGHSFAKYQINCQPSSNWLLMIHKSTI